MPYPGMVTPGSAGELLRWRNWALARVLEAAAGNLTPEVRRFGACLHTTTYDIDVYVDVDDNGPVVREAVSTIRDRLIPTVGLFGDVSVIVDSASGVQVDPAVEGSDFTILFGGFAGRPGSAPASMRPLPVDRTLSRLPLPPLLDADDHWVDHVAVHAAATSAGLLPNSTSAVGIRVESDAAQYQFWLGRDGPDDEEQMEEVTDSFDDGTIELQTVDWAVQTSATFRSEAPNFRWLYRSANAPTSEWE